MDAVKRYYDAVNSNNPQGMLDECDDSIKVIQSHAKWHAEEGTRTRTHTHTQTQTQTQTHIPHIDENKHKHAGRWPCPALPIATGTIHHR
jgi:hypothetical protein